jgi:4-amino-4-deoxy-L-arabinose transferase-like glycosyltransferase
MKHRIPKPRPSASPPAKLAPSRLERLPSLVFVAAIVLVASLLLLWNLGDQRLWQDEANTALVSRTILTHGVPLGHDGVNSFSQELGAEFGPDHIYKWHPWLPFYLLAAFFRIFGVGTFTARLPFALLGIGSGVLVYFLGLALFKKRRVAIAAAALLVFSVPFLLLAKQCRYYSLAMFLSLLGLHGYASGRFRWVLAPASVLLFYTQNIYFLTLWATVLLHGLVFKRERRKELLLLFALSTAACVPWVLYTLGLSYQKQYPGMYTVAQFLRFTGPYLAQIQTHIFSPLLLLAPVAVAMVRGLGKKTLVTRNPDLWRAVALLATYLAVSYLVLCAFSIAPYFRYLGPMIPVFCLLTAVMLEGLATIHWLVFSAVVVWVVLSGNITSYLYEITHAFNGPIKGITNYLAERGKPTDTLAVTYGDLPIKFYTNMRVVGGLAGDDLSVAKDAEWIILRKHVICVKDLAVAQYLQRNVNWQNYVPITIDAPDTVFENREDPALHLFRSNTTEDRVVIWKRTGS